MFAVTEVRIKLITNHAKLLGFADVVIDKCFIIHEVKIVNGNKGVFINMPSRKICDRCGKSNALLARWCNWCGVELPPDRFRLNEDGRPHIHSDLCHPITQECRDLIVKAVMDVYDREKNVPTAKTVTGYNLDMDDYENRCLHD